MSTVPPTANGVDGVDRLGLHDFMAELLRLLDREPPPAPLRPDTPIDDLDLDSLDALEALIFAEERAGLDRRSPVDPTLDTADGWTCLGDLHRYHLTLLARRP